MNNLYHRVAVASVGIALGFALGVNKEVRAATFSFTPASQFSVNNAINNGTGGILPPDRAGEVNKGIFGETRALYEFNLLDFPFDTDIVIREVSFRTFGGVERGNSIDLGIFAYIGNGTPDISDFVENIPISSYFYRSWGDIYGSGGYSEIDFDVTNVFNSFRDYNQSFYSYPFIGFGIYTNQDYDTGLGLGSATLEVITEPGPEARTEPVPEPTTIFGSAIGLCLGGWLKRRKSSPQHKTTPQD